MRQARHLPQRWYWSIVVQVRDVIRQFTQGTPNCNTNPKATVFGIPKEPVLESAELITSQLTGAGSLLPPVYGEAWTKGHATGTPDSTFLRQGVSQGSVLSPVLFSLYITGIEKVLVKHCEVGIFADDIIVSSSGSDVGENELKFNRAIETLNLPSSDVEPHSPSFTGAGLELDGIYFHDQLLTSVTKSSEIPALVNKLALETINGIPQPPLKIYTDGSRGEKGISRSGVYIPTPSGALEFKIKSPDYHSVFGLELIATRRGLQCAAQLEDRFQEIWILTDSRASIQHSASRKLGRHW
ncbi:uncharacterized protein TNCV_1174221 [Trichonephila clavipes]|nr:uncharacterized protein TNCV_1174221 [Trichonephila clavipes]